jgi:L-alanine-DL-glutamate epimerase-like enolase superfamily enzyme
VEYLQGSPYIDEIVVNPWILDADGMLPIPETPGLGIELDWEILPKYSDLS